MLNAILTKVFGSQVERELKRVQPLVDQINELEKDFEPLSDEQLGAKTAEFRGRLEEGEALDDLLPEAFAAVREASRRTTGMRHYDVQLVGGVVLHRGKIAEMKTGEGKTLVATLPIYLNALAGKGVHLVTVNDYLARRDAEWMGPIYEMLGMSVGIIQHDMADSERKEAYQSDITYGTNNEFGFDYLRDNMKFSIKDCVQRGHAYAIVDEVDSILIDEARTPLIISGPTEESTDKYYKIDRIIPRLVKDADYKVDEKARSVVLQESGIDKAETALGVDNLYDPAHIDLVHHIQQALKAHALFKRDVDYMVKDGQVVIVDEFTGRLMPGRRYSDGLHQALEAKEGVKIERESQTYATITFQNYFRMYDKLAGMTGTAETEAAEFDKIYELAVVVIPTNRPLIRLEHSDVVYRTEREKFNAMADEIKDMHEQGRPVLVGTTSIERSERLGKLLKRRGIKHVTLNAKYHEREAEIVAFAGKPGAVTIATNMAGRGTDIILGGNPDFEAQLILKDKGMTPHENPEEFKEQVAKLKPGWQKLHEQVIEAGGLHIVGSERHESRRIDNQLRGRAGRQGDPGSSRFFLSLEDDLMRIFGSDNISGMMQRLGMEEGVPIESKLITKQIERAQKQVEARNFDMRKHLLEYDDVMNKQREEVYRFRRELLEGQDQKEYIQGLAEDVMAEYLDEFAPSEEHPEDWNLDSLRVSVRNSFALELPSNVDDLNRPDLEEAMLKKIRDKYAKKEEEMGPEQMRWMERMVMLQIIDAQWKDHLLNLDRIKEGIGLRGYAQRDPLVEYKRESYSLFQEMWQRSTEEMVRMLYLLTPVAEPSRASEALSPKARAAASDLSYSGGESGSTGVSVKPQQPQTATNMDNRTEQAIKQVVHKGPKVGRNDPCPCGSGKKYKKCCGRPG
ncbi:MAG TPA: preprotein translocase subunit SecA [Acidobacteriota bacterium]|nr:preprotein translocase subunit SecA [Acidobacteriota bacterium]